MTRVYDASLAERRYAACDPDNRLIAAQLEKSWEAALRRVEDCEARLEKARQADLTTPILAFTGLAADLDAAWRAPNVEMRCRQQLLRALVSDIIADINEEWREVILTIHWIGGQHSLLRIRKPNAGEHGQSTLEAALAVMRSMATRWSDADIAATLNRMGMQTGQGKTWTARRVGSLRTVHKIHGHPRECDDRQMRASPDRIDSNGHYTPDNVQIVCWFINRWKGADDNQLVVRLIEALRQPP